MKFLVSQLSYFVSDRQVRQNLGALGRYLLFVLAVIFVYTIVFHFLMLYVEDQRHSWLTGFYWTLTVMSTLGFGDITFHSDIGRLFSIVVLLSGTVLLLIMLPFTFIRYFYAPWLEAQIQHQAPRGVAAEVEGHVVICRFDAIARALIRKLELNRIPYFVLEPDAVAAARMMSDGISVVTGQIDSRKTYERLRVETARMVFVNAEDTTNTNITLTLRAASAEVPIYALAEEVDSIDILELSGATYIFPLKQKLGEHLAARIFTGADGAHVVGRFKDLQIAEFIVHATNLAGKTLKEARLRELTGINVVGVWEQGRLEPVRPELQLSPTAVPVVIGSEAQVDELNRLLGVAEASQRSVLVIGGGKVGRATAASLKRRGLSVHIVERDEALRKTLEKECDHLVIGDAAARGVLGEAGLQQACAVALTTNNDAINIHLAVYCRRLKPGLNIVSRVTHERNIEAIYRAGTDSALSYTSLGREYIFARLFGREPIMVGEGADFFLVPVPDSLAGKTLSASEIGARTGLVVIAVEDGQQRLDNPSPATPLKPGSRLLMLGTAEQREAFSTRFG